MKIFINPGHGGTDCGAVGNGLKERDVALKIGKRVESYLRAVGYDVKLFQYDGLQGICDAANAYGADLFVSIHCNAGGGTGTETFYYEYSNAGKKLAACIQRQIVNSLGTRDRGLKTKISGGYDSYVCKYTDMPAVLVETAFIDNPDDAKLLVEHEDDFARAIARGVTDYFAKTSQNLTTEKPLPDAIDTPVDAPQTAQPYKNTSKPCKLSEHFAASEFVCHCCGQGANKIAPRLIELLEQLRAMAGAPVQVNCGYRCPKHNAEVGGVEDSQHVLGTAADITIPQISFDSAVKLVQSLPFDGTGFYPPLKKGDAWFIHCDTRDGGIGAHIEWWD